MLHKIRIRSFEKRVRIFLVSGCPCAHLTRGSTGVIMGCVHVVTTTMNDVKERLRMKTTVKPITIRPETHGDYKAIVSLVLRSFREGTDYSDGTDIVALIEEIRDSEYRIPELSFVAERDGEIVGHFLFSRFPLSKTPQCGHGGAKDTDLVMLAPVSVHADYLRQGIGSAMLKLGIAEVRGMGFNGIIVEGNSLYCSIIRSPTWHIWTNF